VRVLTFFARLLVPLLIVAGLIADSGLERAVPEASEIQVFDTESSISGSSALTSTWYCPTAHSRELAESGIDAEVDLLVTNTSAEPTRVTVYLVSPTSPLESIYLEVPGLASRSLPIAEYTDDELVSALVEAPSSGVAVTRSIRSPYGLDAALCSSLVADEWYVLSADTQADASGHLIIYNPLPTDAVIDLTFASEAEVGSYAPSELTGIVIPAASSLSIRLDDNVRRRQLLTAVVKARFGRVVVDHLQTFNGSSGRVGFSATLASATRSTSWHHPALRLEKDERVALVLFNPTEFVAETELQISSGEGKVKSVFASVGPFDLTGINILPLEDEELATNTLFVSPGNFGITVKSLNGVPIVSAAELGAGPIGSPGQESDDSELLEPQEESGKVELPKGRVSGLSILNGTPEGSGTWMLAAPNLGGQMLISVLNTSGRGEDVYLSQFGDRANYRVNVPGNAMRQLFVGTGGTWEIKSEVPIVIAALHQKTLAAGLMSIAPVKFGVEE
jgi:hypothetical protein|tara:strand:+ start:774 stop:2291 length:1518 start_codon:yes stop_codon:yes gene_type:complete